jgi:hypothetical protein
MIYDCYYAVSIIDASGRNMYLTRLSNDMFPQWEYDLFPQEDISTSTIFLTDNLIDAATRMRNLNIDDNHPEVFITKINLEMETIRMSQLGKVFWDLANKERLRDIKEILDDIDPVADKEFFEDVLNFVQGYMK